MPSGFVKRAAAKAVEMGEGERGAERCPRCESRDTKFCYYNNYNTAQPRYFCRSCRRYWTLGGSLRNVPIGGSSRKRPRPSSPPSNAVAKSQRAFPALVSPIHTMGLAQTSFGPLLSSALPAGFLALGEQTFLEGRAGYDLGLGLGLGVGSGPDHSSSMEDISFGLASALSWPPSLLDEEEALGAAGTWRVESGGGDCFAAAAAAWPDLAVASPAGGSAAPGSGLH